MSDSSPGTDVDGVPNEILKLPVEAEACDLEHESAVVIQEVINLTQESSIAPNTDVLGTKRLGLVKGPGWTERYRE